ncbi:50S ribosomal protein L22 [Dyella jiangningensis]|nr:50S ribosomal protein L22 [Dyella jiangningensis]
MKVEAGQVGHQALEAGNHPAREQADRAAQHERRVVGLGPQRLHRVAQLGKGRRARVAQALSGRRERQAAPLALEQGQTQLFLQ